MELAFLDCHVLTEITVFQIPLIGGKAHFVRIDNISQLGEISYDLMAGFLYRINLIQLTVNGWGYFNGFRLFGFLGFRFRYRSSRLRFFCRFHLDDTENTFDVIKKFGILCLEKLEHFNLSAHFFNDAFNLFSFKFHIGSFTESCSESFYCADEFLCFHNL